MEGQKALRFHLICVLKIKESPIGLEQHEGTELTEFKFLGELTLKATKMKMCRFMERHRPTHLIYDATSAK